ncbi:MAG: cytochrome c oxidase, cbb3-type, CcoQ subunit [Sulfurimonas sp. RIFCSPHIGHO2_12_FULL_36_9]|uniref:cytochrome c oxidase, cbb3-type, CcoQ subunit n=1 Tax=Sulfurimonas sp. RIFCSPLOWO2_12_36_12 TaxID=1802253 RepID=UPI0008D6F6A4|nr:cytochrome c oxidase, cbb3-type, CcoQ subunit [Sulfurimonas sp. RIFCSPLOWO2_12_36_12]OHD96339.1 MAG: cytochrome c oxidase, cbb3-type, CcoQ subunit [Sulfurimonas sp. RIFCSPHIGHO2_12_FULL_36_9]OHD99386.1 MAG: cytochrome c oxidase, cbb3-type, CcoQ subunit [Sulfurimonas sp. RIFCSPLOWO2_02_FULL_36_28]OHE00233.1 MAG: cytochrome c oxidase, cbb3-type, CcoQ subunit [Sulfurimonas sp. RIFCSPLOWO2_12_36_12]OHE07805.1 MAG: cytochrome c oxidase, cbb3-type, CcoQ subunit [Sulfurimonas sp. RIFCSPLOWO2_12_FUL
MNIAELQAYGYFTLTILLVLALYGYIYHLYSTKKDVDGVDYESYSDMALKDDIDDTPVSPKSDKEK